MDPTAVHGSIKYQGIPCLDGQFGLTPGTTPDTGYVRILVRQPEKIKLNTPRPMFVSDSRPQSESATWGFAADSSAIDGNTLTLETHGTLEITSQNGTLQYENVWIADEGVAEERTFLDADGVTRMGIVRITIADERMWWGRRGYVFGSFNKTGVDGEVIAATGKPPSGNPFDLRDLLEIALDSMPTQNPLGEVVASADLATFQPKDKEPRFQTAIDFMQDVIEELRLLPCKQLDGTVDFYSAGEGQDPDKVFFAKDMLLQDLVTRGHDYTPDALLLYSQYPTTEEVVLTFPGYDTMVLPDPRTGEWRPAYEMLPFYGISVADFEALPCQNYDRQVAYATRYLRPYVKSLPRPNDKIPTATGRQPKNYIEQEVSRRANLLVQHAFKAFRIPEEKMNLLPFENALVSTEAGPYGDAVPKRIACRLASFGFRRAKEDGQENSITSIALSRWINRAEPATFYDGEGTFSVQYNTGLLHFSEPMGKIYRRNPDGSVTQIPDEVEAAKPTALTALQPRNLFSLKPPPTIELLVAHTLRGTRDLRAGPGKRAAFPADVAAIQLQERASPEDHFLIAYDKDGNRIRNIDDADRLYPEVRQMVGARKMTAIVPDEGTVVRDDRMVEQAEKIAKPALARPDGLKSRRIKGYGIVTPRIDGVVTQVGWSIDVNGVATTDILIGSLRRNVAMGSMSPMANLGFAPYREGASSPTNAGER